MRIVKLLKKNNGSTLTLVLFMLFMLSVTAIAVITLTGSELSMSIMSSDRSKALLIAQAGAEKAAQVIDEAVAQAQEDARVVASQIVQEQIADYKSCHTYTDEVTKIVKKAPDKSITDTSPFFRVLDNYSNPGEIKILNEEALNQIYEAEYKFQFNKKINQMLTAIMTTDLKVTTANYISKKNNESGSFSNIEEDGKYIYSEIHLKSNDKVISPETNIGTTGVTTVTSPVASDVESIAITSIQLSSSGEYRSPSNGSTYRRKVNAEFGLLTAPKSKTFDIPISYGRLTRVRVNSIKKPSILSGKALIAQKNIISVDGAVNVIGNVITCGSVPTVVTAKGTKINDAADGSEFGGLMAGITTEVWGNSNLEDGINSLEKGLDNSGAFNLPYGFANYSGSFNITGNVATLAYVHTLNSSSSTDHSDLSVSGDTFARSVKIESESNYSEALFKNVYTIDDLRIDGNNAKVKIGKWNGENADANVINKGLLVGLNTGTSSDSSSAVIVAGDSELYINGSVYVGGSTFYKDYTYADSYSTNYNEPYISGMSIQKSDSRPAEAFEMDGNLSNPGNIFYLYNNNTTGANPYTYVNDPTVQQKLFSATYNKPVVVDGTIAPSVDMMTGSTSEVSSPEVPFNIKDRAMHLKYIWDHFWKNDIGYSSYFNTGDIKITTTENPITGKKEINGWCNGGVAANDTIYGPYDGFTDKDPTNYTTSKNTGYNDYGNLMDLFVDKGKPSELDSSTPTKDISSSIIKQALPITLATPNYFKNITSDTFMCYGSENIVLGNDNISVVSNSNGLTSSNRLERSNGYIQGIVYSTGDIYVKAGTNFKGILIAEKNIVFLGDSALADNKINIEYDEGVVDILLSEEEVARFFNHTAADVIMNNQDAILQTIKKKNVKNIKILSWKEI
jgi:hypothetical protein